MQTTRARAVAACLPSTDRDACLAALEGAGYAAAAVAGDADEAIGLVRSLRPSVVLADAILPGGDGVALAERLVRTPLDLYPWLLLKRPAGLRLPGEARLHDLGAQVIDPPLTADAVSRAVSVCEARADRLPPFKAERLEALMTDLGRSELVSYTSFDALIDRCIRERKNNSSYILISPPLSAKNRASLGRLLKYSSLEPCVLEAEVG